MKKTILRVSLGVLAIVASLFLGNPHSSANQINQQNNERLAKLSGRIAALIGDHPKTNSLGKLGQAEIGRLAAERYRVLRQTAEADPAEVESIALSDEVLAKIPADLQQFFEKREELEGELEVIEECEATHGKTLYNLKQGDKSISLHFAEKPKQELLSGTKIRINGIRVGDTLDVGTSDLGSNSFTVASAPLINTFGEHKVAVILVNFQDRQTQPFTTAQAQDVTFNTTSNFYRENSYGQTWLTGDVYGWYTIPVSSTSCDTAAIASYAQQAAMNAGANLSAYTHYVYAFPQTNACAFSGRGSIGGSPSEAWINTDSLGLEVLGHELGHNFGLFHARSMDCGSAVVGGSCTTDEYGDKFDIMGATQPVHFNVYQKERLGWVNNGSSPPLQTVTASGNYWVDAYETVGSGTKGLKILKSTDPTTGMRTWYYLEHRTPSGADSFLSYYNLQNGMVFHTGFEGSGQDIYLLDMTPATASWYDSILVSGQSFTDPSINTTITVLSADSTGAWVQVSMASQPCTHANPSVSVTPGQSQWLLSGSTFTYTLTVVNNESTGCSPGIFNVQTNVPAGWTANYSVPSLNIAPGGSSSASLYVTSPVGTPDGSYNVGASAVNSSNTAYSGTSSAAYTIVSGLNVAVSSSAATYTRSQTVTVNSTIRAGGNPIAGAGVTFTMTKSNGAVTTGTATTNASGVAVFKYAFNRKKDPTGTYQVRAQTSSIGLSGSGTVSFMVK